MRNLCSCEHYRNISLPNLVGKKYLHIFICKTLASCERNMTDEVSLPQFFCNKETLLVCRKFNRQLIPW